MSNPIRKLKKSQSPISFIINPTPQTKKQEKNWIVIIHPIQSEFFSFVIHFIPHEIGMMVMTAVYLQKVLSHHSTNKYQIQKKNRQKIEEKRMWKVPTWTKWDMTHSNPINSYIHYIFISCAHDTDPNYIKNWFFLSRRWIFTWHEIKRCVFILSWIVQPPRTKCKRN